MAVKLSHGDDDLDVNHDINVTPFIDVILVLLIIFMVAAPLSTVDVQVDLPASSATPSPRPDKPQDMKDWPDEESRGRLLLGLAELLAPMLKGNGTLTLGIGTAALVATEEVGAAVAITIGAVVLVLALVVGAMTIRARRQLRRRQELEPIPPT